MRVHGGARASDVPVRVAGFVIRCSEIARGTHGIVYTIMIECLRVGTLKAKNGLTQSRCDTHVV